MTRNGAELLSEWRALVSAISRAQQRLMDEVDDAGLSQQWYAVLHLLLHAENHRLPMSTLAHEVAFTSGGLTKLADRMGREGLIDRRGSDGDRRVVYATLTPAGLVAARAAERAFGAALERHVLPSLTAEELGAMAAWAQRLDAATPEAAVVIAPTQDGTVARPRDPRLPDRRRRPRQQSAG